MLLVAATLAGPCIAFDRIHPLDRIISRGRIWRCALVGGSWPVEAATLVQLRPGLRMVRFGAIETDGVWVAVVRIKNGYEPGSTEAAFVLGDSAGTRLGGLDRLGRDLAGRNSSESERSYRFEIAAARECLRRELPEHASEFGSDGPPAVRATTP